MITEGPLCCSVCSALTDAPIKNSVFVCNECGGVAMAVPSTITFSPDYLCVEE